MGGAQPSGRVLPSEDLRLSRTCVCVCVCVCVNLPTEQFNLYPVDGFMNYRLAFSFFIYKLNNSRIFYEI